MSVRAYKLIEIKTEKSPTFNCWHDERVMRIAEESETGEAMLSTGQSALRNALVRYGGEIGSENIEEGTSRIMTNLAVGRPWDEGLSRTLVEATIASGGLTAAVDAISKVPTFESLLTQAQADPEGKEFAISSSWAAARRP